MRWPHRSPRLHGLAIIESEFQDRAERMRLHARLSDDLRGVAHPGQSRLRRATTVYLYIAALEVNALNCRRQCARSVVHTLAVHMVKTCPHEL
jgi:hypothetical protein